MYGNEVWKPVKGYEAYYAVSNIGRVSSLRQGRIMTPTDNVHGYMIVSFRVNGHRKNQYVHRLVAEHFIENPKNHKYVNHIDYDVKNNRADNLEWCTQQENIKHSVKHMRKPNSTPTKSATGEKYIYKRNNRYRVNYKGKEKTFLNIQEAIRYRNGVIG